MDPEGKKSRSYHDLPAGWPDLVAIPDESNTKPLRVASRDEKREDQCFHVPETSTAGGVTNHGTEHRNDPTSERSLSRLPRPMFIQFPVLLHFRRQHR